MELWSNPDKREQFIKELSDNGFGKDQRETLSEMFQAQDSDLFDVLNHISFEKRILKRKERVINTKSKQVFFSYYKSQKAKEFLHFILKRYEIDGIEELKRDNLGKLIKLNNLGTVKDASQIFGSSQNLIQAYYGIQRGCMFHQIDKPLKRLLINKGSYCNTRLKSGVNLNNCDIKTFRMVDAILYRFQSNTTIHCGDKNNNTGDRTVLTVYKINSKGRNKCNRK